MYFNTKELKIVLYLYLERKISIASLPDYYTFQKSKLNKTKYFSI